MPYKSSPTLLITVLILVVCAYSGCDMGFGDREGCDGYPYVANDVLPDTVTLQVDGPPFRFDLSEAPVFEHSDGKMLWYRAGVPDAGREIVGAFTGGLTGVFELYPRSSGTTVATIVAEDDCRKWDSLGVFVQVTEVLVDN